MDAGGVKLAKAVFSLCFVQDRNMQSACLTWSWSHQVEKILGRTGSRGGVIQVPLGLSGGQHIPVLSLFRLQYQESSVLQL